MVQSVVEQSNQLISSTKANAASWSLGQEVNQRVGPSVSQSVSKSVSHSVSQSVSQTVCSSESQ